MSTISQRFGPLLLAFTDQFDLRWNDRGSGGYNDGAFWHPKPPAGFYPVGGIGVSNYDDQNGRNWALCVAEAELGSGALAAPTRYDQVWNDKGSGADLDGSCWRPVPPDGYVALGDVFMRDHWTAPSPDDVRCVRKDIATFGTLGDLVWNDVHTGSDTDFAAWRYSPPGSFVSDQDGAFAANTFYGVPSHDKPQVMVFVLQLPFPVEHGETPQPPVLDSRSQPADRTSPKVDRTVTVPFTAVVDQDATLEWRLQNSPFYKVQRSVYYRLELFDDNRTSENQTKQLDVTVGVSKTQTDTFEVKTGITVGYEAGVSFIGEASVSASISVELGYSHSTAVSSMQSRTLSAALVTPPDHSGALWDVSYILTLVRGDGTPISQQVDFAANGSFLEQQFPPPAEGAPTVERWFRPSVS